MEYTRHEIKEMELGQCKAPTLSLLSDDELDRLSLIHI